MSSRTRRTSSVGRAGRVADSPVLVSRLFRDLDVAPGRVGEDGAVRAKRQQGGVHLPATSVAEPDEEDVGLGALRPVRSREGFEPLPHEAVRQCWDEVVDVRSVHQRAERVVHHPVDRLTGVKLAELVDERIDRLVDMEPRRVGELQLRAHGSILGPSAVAMWWTAGYELVAGPARPIPCQPPTWPWAVSTGAAVHPLVQGAYDRRAR
jgi:hypothetical protein